MRLIDADKLRERLQKCHDFYVDAYGGFVNLPDDLKVRVDEITNSIAEVVNAETIYPYDRVLEIIHELEHKSVESGAYGIDYHIACRHFKEEVLALKGGEQECR